VCKAPDGKKDNFGHSYCHGSHRGKRKTDDAGVRERDTAREKARENIHNLNKRDRKCKNTYEYVKLEQRI